MKLAQQVCSLELAKKLKELGVKQESLCIWETEYEPVLSVGFESALHLADGSAAAFTVAELGEFFPQDSSDIRIIHKKVAYDWYIKLEIIEQEKKSFKIVESYDNNEANARAKMLIYLLENKLITL